ncbi:unnamed protein product [Rotaria sp. Silwood2]|nr:unnamed protein product [Rotaria sp. Silwood2]
MISTISILKTLDGLIQRINKVTVCQEHLRLISIALCQLQHTLNTRSMEDRRHIFEDIVQTLKAINEIIVGCSENEAKLKGMTYQDLESLLLRLQLRLAQHRVDLTDNYESKIQILSNAYHDQQILVQKVFDEKIRQKLNAIEKRTEENTIEQLSLLREKHFHTIKIYLHCCTELHKSVPLTGLNSDIVVKIAHNFYKISSEDQIQLEHKWKLCHLPLTHTFIQFKPDKSTSFERNESRRLLIGSENHLFQDHHDRRGAWKSDPGSGKTSVSRWLVRHLAQTLLLNGQHSTDYGSLRIPILIRIGEFAEILKE